MRKLTLSCVEAREKLKDCTNFNEFEIDFYVPYDESSYTPDLTACCIGEDYAYWEIVDNKIVFALV